MSEKLLWEMILCMRTNAGQARTKSHIWLTYRTCPIKTIKTPKIDTYVRSLLPPNQ